MRARISNLLGLALAVSALSGCARFKVDYNPAYVAAPAHAAREIPGRAMILSEPADYNYIYSGRPNSFHAGGTTLEMPLGKIVCESAVNVLGGVFSEGCVKSDRVERDGRYAAIIQVRASRFEYAFNQLRNLTMAVTPQVNLAIQVVLMDESRNTYFSQVYDSGTVNDKTTLDTLRPAETINKHTHKIASDLLGRAAADIQKTMEARLSNAAPLPVASKKRTVEPSGSDAGNGSVRDRLGDLKQLYDDGLISKEVYEERQTKILDSR